MNCFKQWATICTHPKTGSKDCTFILIWRHLIYHFRSFYCLLDFVGEMRNVAAGETIVSGMHDYWKGYTNKIDGQIFIKKAILIMRNPYQAMIDEFVRLGFGPNGIVDENRFRSEGKSLPFIRPTKIMSLCHIAFIMGLSIPKASRLINCFQCKNNLYRC